LFGAFCAGSQDDHDGGCVFLFDTIFDFLTKIFHNRQSCWFTMVVERATREVRKDFSVALKK
jgi:hypothetical protein